MLKESINFSTLKYFLSIVIAAFSVSVALQSQETVVVGQVLNSVDKSPIPSVNIYFKNSLRGVQSDAEGYFLIRNTGNQSILVFSSIGYKKSEIKVKPGQSVGIQMELDEENTLLQDVFVIPGTNPALDLMKRVRFAKEENDFSKKPEYTAKKNEQNVILLSKINRRSTNKYLYNQLKKGSISIADSSLVIPLYMAEVNYQLSAFQKKQLSKNIFSSTKSGEKILEKLVGEISSNLNFYENSITVLGKNMVSPLSNSGNIYYNFYLTDSLESGDKKQYEIQFRSKNTKNLAFNGKMWIDSATLAITTIEAELPFRANINFIHDLRISQQFTLTLNSKWSLKSEELTVNMNYELLSDSLKTPPELFIKRLSTFLASDSSGIHKENFAKSDFSSETLNDKLADLNNTPIMATAKWIADVIITGYIPMGKIDIGKIQQIMRLTDIEGFRLTVPFRTNEKLWKNISVGGYLGYGFKNEELKYAAFSDFRFPGNKRRVFRAGYTNDYRRIDYDYNDYMYRENPLVSGDEDISSSIFAFKSSGKLSERDEISLSFANEWNSDAESTIYFRSNTLHANSWLPLSKNNVPISSSLLQQSITLLNRFSFGEKTYDDHTQRVYVQNKKPVIYSVFEVGKYKFGTSTGTYGKVSGAIKQNVPINIGQIRYVVEAGCILGAVPYPLLEKPSGNELYSYSIYQFNMMNINEYIADKFINIHTDMMLNGLILNQIPVIKHLNLREICSFSMSYGSLNNSNRSLLDYPVYLHPLNKPYAEVGVGITNILQFFSLQSVWRLTDLNRPGVKPWGIRSSINISF